jgi:hypothetical protein
MNDFEASGSQLGDCLRLARRLVHFARSTPLASLLIAACTWLPTAHAQTTVEVIEYYIPALNKYFITGRANEKALLDGNGAFTRTGMSFRAFAADSSAPVGTVPICRFYLPAPGPNTHAYLAPTDCATVTSNRLAGFNDEGRDFAVYLPDATGSCPTAAAKPVYRSYNRRDNVNDAGHRFTVDDGTYIAMAARGFDSEGAVFCTAVAADATLALPSVAADAQVTLIPSGLAAAPGTAPLEMRYRTLSSVIKVPDANLVSSSATGFVARGALAVRVGDRVMAGGRFYKVVSAALSGGNTVVVGTTPALNEVFAEFELVGGADLANSNGASGVSSDSNKVLLKDKTLQTKVTVGKTELSVKVRIPRMEVISNVRYSALSASKPNVGSGAVMTVRGSAEIEYSFALVGKDSANFPAGSGSESAWGWGNRPGCFDLWSFASPSIGMEVPVCIEAEVKAEFKASQTSIKKFTNFELIATRTASGNIVWTQSFTPTDTVNTTPPEQVVPSETFVTTTVGIYVAPRIVLNSFFGSLNLFSAKLRGGVESEISARLLPSPCTNSAINSVLKLSYSAPVFALVDGKTADKFTEIVALKSKISDEKGCTVVASGNFVADITGSGSFRMLSPCAVDYRADYSALFSLDVTNGAPTKLFAAYLFDYSAPGPIVGGCPTLLQEAVIDDCTTFRAVGSGYERVPDNLSCPSQTSYNIVFDSSGEKAILTWQMNSRVPEWTGSVRGVTELKKKK